jgi:hypothetical protein
LKIDLDPAEIAVGSSASLSKKKAKEEADFQSNLARAIAAAEASLESERKAARDLSSSRKSSSSVASIASTKKIVEKSINVVSEPKSGLTEQQGAFDYGLLIAFPIMIGTLGFFLFFPYIAPQLAGQVPQ